LLISILIPCHNAQRWVADAIASALAQTWPGKEVVVVDDGSTDRSLDVIKAFGDAVRWQTGPNRGSNPARNRLLELARGEWVQFLDADDCLRPDKVARQVEFLAAHPAADVVYGPVTLEHWSEAEARRQPVPIPEPHDPWVLLARWYLPQTGAPLWRKQAVLDVGGWQPDLPCCQEHELYLRLLMAGKRFAYCGAGGAIYRQWGEQTLSRRNLPELHRRKLAILRRAEDFLRAGNEMTHARLRAINQARFETARMAWRYDPAFSYAIMAQARASEPRFLPDDGPAAPGLYRLAMRLLGFGAAERLADWSRGLRRRRVGA
jgi:glycosyltransferase involved in cell wall biosynthesis